MRIVRNTLFTVANKHCTLHPVTVTLVVYRHNSLARYCKLTFQFLHSSHCKHNILYVNTIQKFVYRYHERDIGHIFNCLITIKIITAYLI